MCNTHSILLRHGDTNKDNTINFEMYDTKAKEISKKVYDIIKENNITNKIIFFSSPEKRCVDTLKLLKKNLILNDIKNKFSFKVNKNLIRWNKKGYEAREDSKKRALKYGKKLKKFFSKNENVLIIYCTHSSILPSIIEGINDKNPGYIKEGSMFYYCADKKDFVLYDY
jgi:broad specificity phosphatase PhoE